MAHTYCWKWNDMLVPDGPFCSIRARVCVECGPALTTNVRVITIVRVCPCALQTFYDAPDSPTAVEMDCQTGAVAPSPSPESVCLRSVWGMRLGEHSSLLTESRYITHAIAHFLISDRHQMTVFCFTRQWLVAVHPRMQFRRR